MSPDSATSMPPPTGCPGRGLCRSVCSPALSGDGCDYSATDESFCGHRARRKPPSLRIGVPPGILVNFLAAGTPRREHERASGVRFLTRAAHMA